MGKQRRIEKLARREAVVRSAKDQQFNWWKFLRMAGRVLVFALIATTGQFALSLLIPAFRTTWYYQIPLFLGIYLVMFRWINQDMPTGARRAPSKP